jgi:dipeptide transport system permease protein
MTEQHDILLTPSQQNWRVLRRNAAAMLGLVVLLVLVTCAVLAPVIAPHDPSMQYPDAQLVPPVWWDAGMPQYLLGTDDLGRDLASRLIYGARFSMSIGLVIVAIAMLIGVLLGAAAGMLRGLAETMIMRLMDMILALPSLLLAIVIVAILGASLVNAAIAVAIVLLPHFVRITRASIVSESSRDYVNAARLDGAHGLRLFAFTLLPNIAAPLIVQSTLAFSSAILDIAALGFLGLGAQPPTPEWGTLLSSSREFIERAPWTVTLPGLAILITVLASNLLGDGLRDALDPKLKR